MKKLGKVLSLVMALALTMCSLSATAFAKENYTQLQPDGYYRFNYTDGATRQDAVNLGASIYGADQSRREIHIYYGLTEEGSNKELVVWEGAPNKDNENSRIYIFWDQVSGDDEWISDNYVIGTIEKINPISGYHFEKITDASQLSGIATDTKAEDLEQILAAAYDIARPIRTAEEYDDDCIAFVYGVEERDTEGGIKNIYTTINTDNDEIEEKMDAAGIQGILDNTGYVYMLVKDPAPTTAATTAAPTTAATSPKTGDTSTTATFIALGVVAVCGLAVVTFATKKER